MNIKGEKGQVLALALAVLGVGAVLIGPFLQGVSIHSIASRNYGTSTSQGYSSDCGIEDAIWRLTNGTLTSQLTDVGDTVSYTLSESINGIAPTISVTRDKVIIATDDFETGNWSGGSGWLNDWYSEGDADIRSDGSPYGGSYDLRLRGGTGYVKRDVDLSNHPNANLQFWAKANSFEGDEEAQCLISANGSDWTAVKTWVNGDDDNTYHYYDIDLSSYDLSSQFWIAFDANMGAANDQFYIDDLAVARVLSGASLQLPNDNFESGDWSGGSYWLYDWYYEGSSQVTAAQSPHEGSYHLRMKRGDSYVDRAADLSGKSSLRLQFWAKARSLEGNDKMYCKVSPDDTTWTTVKTWTSADSDDTYHFNDIDLSPYTMSSEFWIAFDSDMNNDSDFFYVDDIEIVGSTSIAYEIVSVAGDKRTRADIQIDGGNVTINVWQIGQLWD